MSKFDLPYSVFKTDMYPCCWKVGRFEEDDNATHNYFRSWSEAHYEAVRRNQQQPVQVSNEDVIKLFLSTVISDRWHKPDIPTDMGKKLLLLEVGSTGIHLGICDEHGYWIVDAIECGPSSPFLVLHVNE